jgi:AcrR family transcriptional regulator
VTSATERSRLSRTSVVESALALADEKGLDSLTIRGLARHLGVSPMALYWHFKNKDELLSGIANLMWAKVDARPDEALPWLDQLRAVMESLVAVLRDHPAAAQLVMNTPPEDATSCFDVMEAALRALHAGGFRTVEAADVCRHGLRTATSLAIGQPGFSWQRTEAEQEAIRRKRLTLQSLPASRYPHVIEAAEPFTDCENPDGYYQFGIDLFIRGVEALARRRP